MWAHLNSEEKLKELIELSKQTPVLIFKHSTRCSISSMALSRLERSWDIPQEKLRPFLLDLIQLRSVSNKISEIFSIPHESPQLLLIENGKCIYHESHNGINLSDLKNQLKN
jgi:bacillithiol system protein YtxJ